MNIGSQTRVQLEYSGHVHVDEYVHGVHEQRLLLLPRMQTFAPSNGITHPMATKPMPMSMHLPTMANRQNQSVPMDMVIPLEKNALSTDNGQDTASRDSAFSWLCASHHELRTAKHPSPNLSLCLVAICRVVLLFVWPIKVRIVLLVGFWVGVEFNTLS